MWPPRRERNDRRVQLNRGTAKAIERDEQRLCVLNLRMLAARNLLRGHAERVEIDLAEIERFIERVGLRVARKSQSSADRQDERETRGFRRDSVDDVEAPAVDAGIEIEPTVLENGVLYGERTRDTIKTDLQQEKLPTIRLERELAAAAESSDKE